MPEVKTPAGFALYTIGVLVLSAIARVGWEIGGRLWAVF